MTGWIITFIFRRSIHESYGIMLSKTVKLLLVNRFVYEKKDRAVWTANESCGTEPSGRGVAFGFGLCDGML